MSRFLNGWFIAANTNKHVNVEEILEQIYQYPVRILSNWNGKIYYNVYSTSEGKILYSKGYPTLSEAEYMTKHMNFYKDFDTLYRLVYINKRSKYTPPVWHRIKFYLARFFE